MALQPNSYRKGIFIIVYKKENNSISYLLLKRKLHWKGWEFPKGGLEENENEIQTVKREAIEETGLQLKKIKRYSIKGKYKYHKKLEDRPGVIGQTYSLYSAEVDDKEIKIDKREHAGFKWLTFEKAIKKLTWLNQKKCLKIVNKIVNT